MAHPTKTVASHVILLVETAYKLGLKLNISKCEIIADDYSVTRTMKIFDAFRETPPHEPTLLEGPILNGKAVDEALKTKVEALERTIP